MRAFRRRSNSPLALAPACISARSSDLSATFWRAAGTLPAAMRNAKPSTTAVFPTPASPARIGLFWRLLLRISMI